MRTENVDCTKVFWDLIPELCDLRLVRHVELYAHNFSTSLRSGLLVSLCGSLGNTLERVGTACK